MAQVAAAGPLQAAADGATLPELTLRGLVLGALITVLFTAAVISMAVLRFFPGANILENNMVQTQASAAGTLSAIIFVVPGLVMVGHWQGFPFWQTAGICAAGGILGVIYTIPLRRAMVVQSDLPYPDGVAAAEVLRVGSAGREDSPRAAEGGAEPGLKDILLGGGIAAAFSFLASGLKILGDGINWWFAAGAAVFRVGTGFSLALLGAGYLVGIVGGLAMLTGVITAWGIAVPVLTALDPAPAGASIAEHATGIWSSQVRFIGAGAIGVAAVWTLLGLLGPMTAEVRASFAAVRDVQGGSAGVPRTERDMPVPWLAGIGLLLSVAMAALFAFFLGQAEPPLPASAVWALVASGVAFVFLFGFLIATACLHGGPRGLLGEPDLGHQHPRRRPGLAPAARGPARGGPAAAGGFGRRARDRRRALHHLPDRRHRRDLQRQPARPQDRLAGGSHALARRGGSARLPPLAVGIGIYLPPTVSMTIVIGAIVGWFLNRALRRRSTASAERAQRRAVLVASGLIVGESLVGVLLAGIIAASGGQQPLALVGEDFEPTASWLGLAVFLAVCLGFYRYVLAAERRNGVSPRQVRERDR